MKNEEATRTRGKSLAVNTYLEALVLKRALEDFTSGLDKGGGRESLISPEDILAAAEGLLDRVDSISFLAKTEARAPALRPKSTKPAASVNA